MPIWYHFRALWSVLRHVQTQMERFFWVSHITPRICLIDTRRKSHFFVVSWPKNPLKSSEMTSKHPKKCENCASWPKFLRETMRDMLFLDVFNQTNSKYTPKNFSKCLKKGLIRAQKARFFKKKLCSILGSTTLFFRKIFHTLQKFSVSREKNDHPICKSIRFLILPREWEVLILFPFFSERLHEYKPAKTRRQKKTSRQEEKLSCVVEEKCTGGENSFSGCSVGEEEEVTSVKIGESGASERCGGQECAAKIGALAGGGVDGLAWEGKFGHVWKNGTWKWRKRVEWLRAIDEFSTLESR